MRHILVPARRPKWAGGLAIVLLASLLIGAPAVSVSKANAQPAAQSVLPRVIPLEGASNFRDVGGYRTADGRRVRTGLVFRSDSPDFLTTADFHTLNQLGVRTFCDLRDTQERNPNRPAGVDVPEIITWADSPKETRDYSSPEAVRRETIESYRHLPERYARPVGDIFRRIAKGDVPLMFHCSAGKDRTGFTTAILLRTLGVSEETVMADYLASNRYFDGGRVARELAKNPYAGFGGQALSPETLAVILSVEREWLEASFASIEARYGSLDGYLTRGLGLSRMEIAAIRRRMLEPAAR